MSHRLVRTDRHGLIYEIDPVAWTETLARREARIRNGRRHSKLRFWVVRPDPVGAVGETISLGDSA